MKSLLFWILFLSFMNAESQNYSSQKPIIAQENKHSDCVCAKSKGSIISIMLIDALRNLSSLISAKTSIINDRYSNATAIVKNSDSEEKYESLTRAVVGLSFGLNNNIKIKSVDDKYITELGDKQYEEKCETITRIIIKNPKTIVDYYYESSTSNSKKATQTKLEYMDKLKSDTLILEDGSKKIYNTSGMESFNNWFIKTIQENGLIIQSDIQNSTIEICYEKKKVLEQLMLQMENIQGFDITKYQKIFNEEMNKMTDEQKK